MPRSNSDGPREPWHTASANAGAVGGERIVRRTLYKRIQSAIARIFRSSARSGRIPPGHNSNIGSTARPVVPRLSESVQERGDCESGPPSPIDAEIIDGPKNWNVKAEQIATLMAQSYAESFAFEDVTNLKPVTDEQSVAMQNVSEYIMPDLVKSFGRSQSDIHRLLQAAFQASLAFAFYRAVSIRGIEPVSNQQLGSAESLIAGITDVLLAAGCTTAKPEVMSNVRSQLNDGSPLAVLSQNLDTILNNIAKSNFEVFIARPHEKFECDSMEEADGNEAAGKLVLCTVSVGLIKRIPANIGVKQSVALKAKVLLKSFLD